MQRSWDWVSSGVQTKSRATPSVSSSRISTGTHVGALCNHDRVDLVAGSSRDDGRRERYHARYGVPVFADWREMFRAAAPLDIVSVATYAPVHAEITHAAVEAGARAIYCEKPIATDD